VTNESSLNAFKFEDSSQSWDIRFVGNAEIPEWVAADIVAVLYPEARRENLSNYLSKVPSEWKGNKPIITPGGRQEMSTLFEPGLYCLIARSDSPIAVPFQKWVYEEVLPSIRKTGSYSIVQQSTQSLLPPARERLENVRLGLDIMYELGGIDERTQLAVKDIVKDILLEDKLLKPSNEQKRFEVPISDRARQLGYNPNKGQLQKLGKTAVQFYRLRYNEDPPKREQFVDGTTRMVNCYSTDDIDILDQAIAVVMEVPKQLPQSNE
jgi:prophage antirepressor-like protein